MPPTGAADRSRPAQAGDVVGRKLEIDGGHADLHRHTALGAGNGNDVIALGEQPGERDADRRYPMRGRHLFHRFDDAKIGVDVAILETRVPRLSIVTIGDGVARGKSARQEATAKR